eukprot:CFRG5986T1
MRLIHNPPCALKTCTLDALYSRQDSALESIGVDGPIILMIGNSVFVDMLNTAAVEWVVSTEGRMTIISVVRGDSLNWYQAPSNFLFLRTSVHIFM